MVTGMSRTILIKDRRFIEHRNRPGHPECPERLEGIYAMLESDDMRGRCEEVEPRPALKEEIAWNHSPQYIDEIEKTAGRPFTYLDPDTSTSEGSWEAAILAAGGFLHALDVIIAGQADNGFALVRPPGHHAEAGRAMGFCLFNNVAIGAHYLLKKHGLSRVMILDWDIHHGNGTQNAFYDSPQVLYCSSHQYPYYPGSGAFEEVGSGDGRGYTINMPLPGGQGDDDFVCLYANILAPVVEEFRPEFILVSAGYDIYCRDPLGAMEVTPAGCARLTGLLKGLAGTSCGGRLLLGLEGGYHLQGIAESVQETVLALSGPPAPDVSVPRHADAHVQKIIDRVRSVHRPYWKSLA
jgi:acetoin utilization deacetylase AcuC-like enzyme